MKTKFCLLAIVLTLLAAVRQSAAAPAVFPIATSAGVLNFSCGIAHGGGNYLVGMEVGKNVVGQLVSSNGTLQGPQIVVGSNPGFPPNVALAFGQTNYLLAWSDNSISNAVDMYGQFISPSGAKVGAKFNLLQSQGAHGFQNVLALASDGTNFLVVWADGFNADTETSGSFYGQLVNPDGTLSGPEFLISDQLQNGNDASVTFGTTNYLVVWQSNNGSIGNTNQTYGEFITQNGVPGSWFQIGQTASVDQNPLTVAFDGTNFFAAWSWDPPPETGMSVTNWDLYGRLVSQDGTLPGSELQLVTDAGSQEFPSLAFNGSNYLLAWSDQHWKSNGSFDTTNYNIRFQFFDRSGSAVGSEFTFFSPVGKNRPLLPFNGLLFDGTRFAVAATLGTLAFANGNVSGIPSSAVYGAFIPADISAPSITSQPTNQTVTAGTTAILSASASGTAPLAYHWFKNSVKLAASSHLSGVTNDTLTIHSVTPADAGTYFMVVSNSVGTATSSNAVLTVFVPDVTKPTLAITNPAKTGEKWSNMDFTVSGKAADNVAISNVLVSLNGADWVSADLSNSGSNWTTQVSLIPGTNTISAFAMDTSGNVSMTDTVKLVYIVSAILTVSTNGGGGISPAYNGKTLQIGANYSMTAKADTGSVFVNWTDGLGNVITNSATLKFIMTSNLTFVANFKDIAKPTLTIMSPTANQKWSNSVFTVTGKAADNVAISNVLVSLNGADWVSADLSNGGSNWTTQVTLIPGTNAILAFAVDTSGNVSTTDTVKVIYFPDTRTIVGSWNLIQFQTPAQITGDMNDGLQGGTDFAVEVGSLIINSNGTCSGNLGDDFAGTYTNNGNGVITLNLTNSQAITFFLNTAKDTMTEVDSLMDADDNEQEIVVAHRIPDSVTMADLAGSWNLLQFQTPAQMTDDSNNGLQGGDSFKVANGTLTLKSNGALSGKLENSFSGTFTIDGNGIITLHTTDSETHTFYLNFSKDTMTLVDSQVDADDNQQEMVVAHREPASVKAADLAGSWNLVQFQTPAQMSDDGNDGLQGGGNFAVTNGTLTVNANGTVSGTLGDAFTGHITTANNGVIHLNISVSGGSETHTFYINAGKDTMTLVDSKVDADDNQQEMVVAHRIPAD